jgi:2-polyprenyl-3-methyl-5-hydroxy-6-metoxy-1,4-benzoquinol methylase
LRYAACGIMTDDLRNRWQWFARWSPQACAAVQWACEQFPPTIQQRGIARVYYSLVWELDQILRVLPHGAAGLRVMDVGCGAGVLALALRHLGAHVTAVDRFEEYDDAHDNQMGNTREIVERFRKHGIEVINRDVMDGGLPPGGDGQDLITFLAVIEHLHESPKALLAAMHGALRPGGVVAVTMPNHAWIRTRLRLLVGRPAHDPLEDWWRTPFYGHVREYTLAELKTMLEWSGFEVVHTTVGNWSHASSRVRSNTLGEPDRWTTRFTLDSTERWVTAASWLVTAAVPSLRYSVLGIGRRP